MNKSPSKSPSKSPNKSPVKSPAKSPIKSPSKLSNLLTDSNDSLDNQIMSSESELLKLIADLEKSRNLDYKSEIDDQFFLLKKQNQKSDEVILSLSQELESVQLSYDVEKSKYLQLLESKDNDIKVLKDSLSELTRQNHVFKVWYQMLKRDGSQFIKCANNLHDTQTGSPNSSTKVTYLYTSEISKHKPLTLLLLLFRINTNI